MRILKMNYTNVSEVLTANQCGLKNLEKLGNSREYNLLILTGISGSGKTTLSKKLEELENVEVLHLDDYLDTTEGFNKHCEFSSWLNSRRPVLQLRFQNGYFTDKLIDWFFTELFLYAESQYPNRIVVAEGLHWLDPDISEFFGKAKLMPIAVCDVDVEAASRRSNNSSMENFRYWQDIWHNNIKELLS